MAAARTVFIDTTLPNYAALVAQYDADVFNIVLLSSESPRVEQIQIWLTNNGASPADINIVSSSNSVNGVITPRVVFVDPGIADLDTVIAGMPGNATVVVLDASRDGVQQIHDYLSANTGMVSAIDIVTDIASVDVVSHGSPGEIKLGSTVLNMDTLAGYGSQLAAIGSHLSAAADLLLYGCDVASGAIGEQFIAALAAVTGVDVAASNDLTGSAAAGGDWVLEANTGTIETAALNIANYAGLLDTVTSITALKLSDDTGSSSSDFVTKTDEQTITGSFTASGKDKEMPEIWVSTGGLTASRTLATITEYADPNKTVNGETVSGMFSVKVKLVPGAGSIQFWTSANSNGNGNSSQIANSAKGYTLDTTKPGSDVATLALSRDSGDSASDFITDTAAQTISGTLSANTAAGEIVRISLDNGATWQTATNTVGQKTFSLSGVNLPGSGTIKVQVEDAAGNAGTAFSQAYVVDTVAPATGVLSFSDLVDSGTAGDGITSDPSFSLALAGNEAGSSVIYETSFQQGVFVPTTVSQTTLADGSYLFRARVTDLAGNTSTTNTIGVTIDTVAPGAPVMTGFADNSGSGSDTTTMDQTPTLTMSAEANMKVEVYRNGVSVGMASQTASDSGIYTFASAALPDGSYTFTAKAIDAAGNTSPVSLSQIVTVDTTLTAPTAALVTDSGTPGDGLTNSAALAFNNADADAKRVIKVDGEEVGTYDPAALAEGKHTVDVTDTDTAGNVKSTTLAFTLDTKLTAPTAALVTDSGTSGDGLTNSAALAFNNADADAKRVIKVDGKEVGTYDPAALAEGKHTVDVADTDTAGNVKSTSLAFTLDTKLTAPTAALVTDSGTPGDGLTNSAVLAFNNADPDAKRVIKVDGKEVGTYDPAALAEGKHTVDVTDTDTAGNVKSTTLAFTLDTTLTAPTAALVTDSGTPGDWLTNTAALASNNADADAKRVIKVDGAKVDSYDPSALADGKHTVELTDTDDAGNVKSTSLVFTLDTTLTAPTAALVTDSGTPGDGLTNSAALAFNNADPDAKRVIKVDGEKVDSYDPGALADGKHTVDVTDTDDAGNVKSTKLAFTLDTTLTAPTAALVTDSGTPGDGLTNSAALAFNNADPDAKRVIKVDDKEVGTYDPAALAEGKHTVDVTDTDAAGNVKSSSLAFTLDRTGPQFTSPTRIGVAENIGEGQLVYQSNAADQHAVVYSLAGNDAGKFAIRDDGSVILVDNPNFETRNAYSFTVAATDAAGNRSEQSVALGITNVNEAPDPLKLNLTTFENAPIIVQFTDAVSDQDVGDRHTLSFDSNVAKLSWVTSGDEMPSLINPVTKKAVDLDLLSVKATLSADGTVVTITPPPELDWMLTGQTLKASFSYTATDAGGLSSRNVISVTINGSTNDKGVNLNGGNGNDTLSGNAANNAEDVLQGGNGNDVLSGFGGTDALYGGNGDDKLIGEGGIDYLYGDSGNDTLYGGAEGDFLFGGKGNDILDGGAGADKFVFESQNGNDRIQGFNVGEGDKLFLAGFFSAPMSVDAFLSKYVTDTGADLLISLPGTSLVLVGIADAEQLRGAIDFTMPF